MGLEHIRTGLPLKMKSTHVILPTRLQEPKLQDFIQAFFLGPNGELNSLELHLSERSIRAAVEALGDLNNVENRFVAFKIFTRIDGKMPVDGYMADVTSPKSNETSKFWLASFDPTESELPCFQNGTPEVNAPDSRQIETLVVGHKTIVMQNENIVNIKDPESWEAIAIEPIFPPLPTPVLPAR